MSNTPPRLGFDDMASPLSSMLAYRRPSMGELHASQRRASRLSYLSPLVQESKIPKILRVQLIVIIVTITILAAIYWHQTFDYVQIILQYIGKHPYFGSIIFILIFVVFTNLFIPASLIVIGCGFVYYHQFGIRGIIAACLLSTNIYTLNMTHFTHGIYMKYIQHRMDRLFIGSNFIIFYVQISFPKMYTSICQR